MGYKRIIFIIWTILVITVMWSIQGLAGEYGENYRYEEELIHPVRAKVLSIRDEKVEELGEGTGIKLFYQELETQIKEGIHKGKIVYIENVSDAQTAYNIVGSAGRDIFVVLEEDSAGNISGGYVYELVRDQYLLYLAILFAVLLILIGRWKGLKSILTLIFMGIAIVKVMLPMILAGYSPIWVSIGSSIVIIGATFLIVSGWNKKTLCAVIGTSGGVIAAGVIAFIVSRMASLTGLGLQETQMLQYIPQRTEFHFEGLLFAGIILGALGAAMDVSMSIASSVYEIEVTKPDIDTNGLIRAGMNVGRDIMGTMSNTLILAYVGTSLPLMLLFLAYDIPITEIINRDMIASEIVRSLAGSIGLFLTVPITAFVSGMIRMNKQAPAGEK